MFLRTVLPALKGAPLEDRDHVDRALGLAAILAETGAAAPLLEASSSGDESRTEQLVERIATGGEAAPPIALHHLALLYGRFARSAPDLPRAIGHEKRALVCWLRLWNERSYLAEVAGTVAGDQDLAHEIVASLPRTLLERHAEELSAGRKAATPAARRAAGLLRAVDACAEAAGLGDAERAEVARIAAASIARVACDVIDEARHLAEHADPLRSAAEAREAPFRHVLGFAEWAGFDHETILFLLGQAQDFGWELYRARRTADLRTLLLPLLPAAEELRATIDGDPALVGFRALCAQYFTFLGETETRPGAAIERLETAVAICPTHRNARLILADLLIQDAGRRLDALPARPLFGSGEARRTALSELARTVERAGSLWPSTKVPAALETALAELEKR